MAARLRRLLRDPIVHFALLGAALFALFALVREGEASGGAGGAGGAGRAIVLGPAEVEQTRVLFERRWGRPPTAAELRGLIEARVREEVLYREALGLGLDRDDTVVRRRLAQKMEFLFEDLAAAAPEEGQLRAFLEAHPDRFREPPRATFAHVYVSRDRRGAAADGDARRLLETLRRRAPDGDPADHGDRLPIDAVFVDAGRREIAARLGAGFAERVLALEPGRWHGPVESGYGLHLVFVRGRTPARLPPLAEIEATVRRDWEAERRREANETAYAALRARYDVEIAWPEPRRTATAADEPAAVAP